MPAGGPDRAGAGRPDPGDGAPRTARRAGSGPMVEAPGFSSLAADPGRMAPASQRATESTADWQAMLQALEDRHRRQLLVTLLDHHPSRDRLRVPDDMGETALDAPPEELIHHHLPTLEIAGYIQWDKENHEVMQGPKFNEIRPLVQLLHDHRDELPDGWL